MLYNKTLTTKQWEAMLPPLNARRVPPTSLEATVSRWVGKLLKAGYPVRAMSDPMEFALAYKAHGNRTVTVNKMVSKVKGLGLDERSFGNELIDLYSRVGDGGIFMKGNKKC